MSVELGVASSDRDLDDGAFVSPGHHLTGAVKVGFPKKIWPQHGPGGLGRRGHASVEAR